MLSSDERRACSRAVVKKELDLFADVMFLRFCIFIWTENKLAHSIYHTEISEYKTFH